MLSKEDRFTIGLPLHTDDLVVYEVPLYVSGWDERNTAFYGPTSFYLFLLLFIGCPCAARWNRSSSIFSTHTKGKQKNEHISKTFF